MADPNLEELIKVARGLGPLREEAVFVGGAVVGLLVTDPAAERIRSTEDVDLIVAVATKPAFAKLEVKLRAAGFLNDPEGPICRWIYRGVRVDVMPDDEKLLGFSNRWYGQAIAGALDREIAPGLTIRCISAPCFIATKLVAFDDRGGGDHLASPDLEDVIAVVDGRETLSEEVRAADPAMRRWVARRIAALLQTENFLTALPALISTDDRQSLRTGIVLDRLQGIAKAR